jgi:peptidoglycan/LPS O-acetylase OafA/YrhL
MSPERHLRLSLGLLAVFLAMGLWLEAMIGLRLGGWADDDLRREFLRLGHAHGGLLALVNLALAWALERLKTPTAWARRIRGAAWIGALLVGAGFVAGGLLHGPTDPGMPVLIVPAGALMLVMSLVACALVRPGDLDPPA